MTGRTAKTFSLMLALAAALVLSSCGESKEDKALTAVCGASADIQKNIDALKALTFTSVTLDTVQTSVTAIRNDLTTIKDNIPTLKDSVKPQFEAANSEFQSKLTSIVLSLGKSLSVDDGAEQFQAALAELATAYGQAFASLDCPDAK